MYHIGKAFSEEAPVRFKQYIFVMVNFYNVHSYYKVISTVFWLCMSKATWYMWLQYYKIKCALKILMSYLVCNDSCTKTRISDENYSNFHKYEMYVKSFKCIKCIYVNIITVKSG